MAQPDVSTLLGAYIERVDRPFPGLYALSLSFNASRCALLLAAGPPRVRPAWALVPERPRGEAADAQVRGLREKLEGARLSAFGESREGWALKIEGKTLCWRFEGSRNGVTCVLCPEHEHEHELWFETPTGDRLVEAFVRGESFVEEQGQSEGEWARREALATLRRARARLERRVAAVEADLEAIERAQAKAHEVSPFVASAARAVRGARTLEAIDWSSGEAKKVALELDPTRPAREQLEAIFARARRLRGGAQKAELRRDEATLALFRVDEARAAVEAAEGARAIGALVEALARELPGDLRAGRAGGPASARGRKGALPEREAFRRYEGEGGAAILVGRDAASNDELTVRVARPGDLWLHAKGGAGSHVVVPGGCKRGAPDAGALVDAATLAAHFSSLRGEAVVDVLYADRRHVRKRKGSALGEVEVLRSKALALRVEPGRLGRLLASRREGR